MTLALARCVHDMLPMNLEPRASDLLAYWFGPPTPDRMPDQVHSNRWFLRSETTDRDLRERFGDLIEMAASHRLDAWKFTARGRLALILALDQLPRNVFRGTPRAFAHDPYALSLCLEAIEGGTHLHLQPIERMFVYMPLQHSEDPSVQARSVEWFERVRDQATGPLKAFLDKAYDFALQHQVIIDRFGRFPHRNAILGRASTAEEEHFLTQPGSSF